MEIPFEKQWIPAPQQATQPRTPGQEMEVSITSGRENQWGLQLNETEGCWRPRDCRSLWDRAQTHLLTNSLALISSTWAAAQKAPETDGEELT